MRPRTCQAWSMATPGSRGTWWQKRVLRHRSREQGKESGGPSELFSPRQAPMAAIASSYYSCCPFPAAQPGG